VQFADPIAEMTSGFRMPLVMDGHVSGVNVDLLPDLFGDMRFGVKPGVQVSSTGEVDDAKENRSSD
jgi:hypothetical protein